MLETHNRDQGKTKRFISHPAAALFSPAEVQGRQCGGALPRIGDVVVERGHTATLAGDIDQTWLSLILRERPTGIAGHAIGSGSCLMAVWLAEWVAQPNTADYARRAARPAVQAGRIRVHSSKLCMMKLNLDYLAPARKIFTCLIWAIFSTGGLLWVSSNLLRAPRCATRTAKLCKSCWAPSRRSSSQRSRMSAQPFGAGRIEESQEEVRARRPGRRTNLQAFLDICRSLVELGLAQACACKLACKSTRICPGGPLEAVRSVDSCSAFSSVGIGDLTSA